MRNAFMVQKKFIGMSAGAVAVFVLAGLLIYRPAREEVSRLKAEVGDIERQIRSIQALVGAEGGSGDAGITALDARYRALSSKFPQREEKALAALYEAARKLNLEVVTLTTQSRITFTDDKKQQVSVDGRACQRLPVSLSLTGRYKDAHDYIVAVRESLPAYATIEHFRMIKNGVIPGALMITMEITLYLLS